MYIVSYDISETRLRNKIAKLLLNYGKRVQYSVFECYITQTQYTKMYKELISLMKCEGNDSIRIYHLCGKCELEIKVIGIADNSPNWDEVFII